MAAVIITTAATTTPLHPRNEAYEKILNNSNTMMNDTGHHNTNSSTIVRIGLHRTTAVLFKVVERLVLRRWWWPLSCYHHNIGVDHYRTCGSSGDSILIAGATGGIGGRRKSPNLFSRRTIPTPLPFLNNGACHFGLR